MANISELRREAVGSVITLPTACRCSGHTTRLRARIQEVRGRAPEPARRGIATIGRHRG
jgi:hypothetical protein